MLESVVTNLCTDALSMCTLGVTACFAWGLAARITEYYVCRAKLSKACKHTIKSAFFLRMVQEQKSRVRLSMTMAELLDKMGTTRSRWYVLRLAVRRIKQTSLREEALEWMDEAGPDYLTGWGRLAAWFKVAV